MTTLAGLERARPCYVNGHPLRDSEHGLHGTFKAEDLPDAVGVQAWTCLDAMVAR